MPSDLIATVLERWLRIQTRRPTPYRFEITDVTERIGPDEQIIEQLGQMMLRNKVNVVVLDQMRDVLGWPDASARLRRSRRVGVRRGDFGEAFASELLEIEGYQVPIRKLRYQMDPEQALHGTDIVGFDIAEDGQISGLHFVEAKLRTGRDLAAGVQAHQQLVDDRMGGYADTLMFLAERLNETDQVLSIAFSTYLASRERSDRGSYGIFLVWDSRTWDEDALVRINEVDDLLDPLHVRAATIGNLGNLVEQSYNAIGSDVIEDGT